MYIPPTITKEGISRSDLPKSLQIQLDSSSWQGARLDEAPPLWKTCIGKHDVKRGGTLEGGRAGSRTLCAILSLSHPPSIYLEIKTNSPLESSKKRGP